MKFLRFLIFAVILTFTSAQLPNLNGLPLPAGLPVEVPAKLPAGLPAGLPVDLPAGLPLGLKAGRSRKF